MAKLAAYLFTLTDEPIARWFCLGCFHSADEAYAEFKKRHGELNIRLVRVSKSYFTCDGHLKEDF